jgi:hypothetical protein
MTTREKIIVGIMCLTIAYGAYDLFGRGGAKRPPAVRAQEPPLEEVRRFATELTQKIAADRMSDAEQYVIDQTGADWSKDPFIPSVTPLASQPPSARTASIAAPSAIAPALEYLYTGFLQIGDTKLAVINGMEYAQGEALGTQGHYIRSISAQRVVIGKVNGMETIHLPLREID